MLTFHWRGGYLTRAVLDELLDLIKKAGAEKGKVARIAFKLAPGSAASGVCGRWPGKCYYGRGK